MFFAPEGIARLSIQKIALFSGQMINRCAFGAKQAEHSKEIRDTLQQQDKWVRWKSSKYHHVWH